MSRDTNDLKFWAQIKPGCQIGSKGYEQFEQQAARILSTMPFSVLFSNSVYADGTVSLLRPEKDLEAGQFRGLGDDANVVVRIANEKIANLYNEDQSVNADVLRVCLEPKF